MLKVFFFLSFCLKWALLFSASAGHCVRLSSSSLFLISTDSVLACTQKADSAFDTSLQRCMLSCQGQEQLLFFQSCLPILYKGRQSKKKKTNKKVKLSYVSGRSDTLKVWRLRYKGEGQGCILYDFIPDRKKNTKRRSTFESIYIKQHFFLKHLSHKGGAGNVFSI